MKTVTKSIWVFLSLMFFSGFAISQNETTDSSQKAEKQMIILKKTVDENGKERIIKIIITGDDVELKNLDKIGLNEDEILFQKIEDTDGKNTILLFSPNEISLRHDLLDIEVDSDNIEGSRKISIKKIGKDGEEIFKWEGEDMEEMCKTLKEKGIEMNSFIYPPPKNCLPTPCEEKAFLGVMMARNFSSESEKKHNGALIGAIVDGSSAEKAGLQSNDVIIQIDKYKIENFYDITDALAEKNIGDKVKIKYIRNSKSGKTKAILSGRAISRRHCKILLPENCHKDLLKCCDKSINNCCDKEKMKNCQEKKIIIEEEIDDNSDSGIEMMEDEGITIDTKLELKSIQLFPNPTDGNIDLQFKAEAVPTEVIISDTNGKAILIQNIRDFNGIYTDRIDLSDAAKGTFILTIRQGEKIFTEKIILN